MTLLKCLNSIFGQKNWHCWILIVESFASCKTALADGKKYPKQFDIIFFRHYSLYKHQRDRYLKRYFNSLWRLSKYQYPFILYWVTSWAVISDHKILKQRNLPCLLALFLHQSCQLTQWMLERLYRISWC
jgi:hypothetical protein